MDNPEQRGDQLWRAALREADAFQLPPDWTVGRQRVDGVAIDDASTRDRDDAILRLADGDGLHVYTSIAAVAEFVHSYPAVIDHAAFLGETRYVRSAPRSMIPGRIGERALSLSADHDTPALTQAVQLGSNFEVLGTPRYFRSIIRPSVVTYEDVAKMTHGEGPAEDVSMFRQYEAFALDLLRARQGRGALAYYNVAQGLMTNEDGQPIVFEAGVEHSGQLIVQEHMILRNAATGLFMMRNGIPGVFRRHRMMRPVDLAEAVAVLQREGREGLARVMAGIGRAWYDIEPGPHDALGIPAYAQDSSPIRRFGDVINQANILAFFSGDDYPYQGDPLRAHIDRLNEVREELRGPSPHFRGVDRRVSDKRLEGDASTLSLLDKSAFYRVAKAAVRTGQAPVGFREAVAAKLVEVALPGEDIATLLFAPHVTDEWVGLKTQLLTFLTANVSTSAHVLAIARAQRMVDDVQEIPLPGDARGAFRFRTDITRGEEVFSAEESHGTRDGARYLSGLRAMGLANGIDVFIPEGTLPVAPAGGMHVKNVVNTHLQRSGQPPAEYTTVTVHTNGSVSLFESRTTVDGVEYVGHGGTKKAAETAAAEQAAAALNLASPSPAGKGESTGQPSPTSFLNERSQRLRLPEPQYKAKQTGPPHNPTFTVTVTVAMPEGEPLQFTGRGKTKAEAKLAASQLAKDAISQ